MISNLTHDFDYNYVPELLQNINIGQMKIKQNIGRVENEIKIKEELLGKLVVSLMVSFLFK